MATPKEMVDERLAELGISKSEFAKRLGYTGYQGYYDLFSGERTKLTPEKLEQIAAVLEWPKDHFKAPGNTLKRDEYIRKEFRKYLDTEVGRDAHPETHRILESMRWTGDFLPSKELFVAVTVAMEGRYTTVQIAGAMKLEQEDAKAAMESSQQSTSVKPLKRKRVT